MNLKTKIGRLNLQNPIMVASGTFGFAEEFKDFIDLKRLGAVVSKTITLKPRLGNPPPRTCETPAGMLNSIGLENPGLGVFLKDKLPFLIKIGVPVIVSVAAEAPNELEEIIRQIDRTKVDGIELNLSCPNVKRDKLIHSAAFKPRPLGRGKKTPLSVSTLRQTPAFRPGLYEGLIGLKPETLVAQHAPWTKRFVAAARKLTKKTLITKLTPNVTDIVEIAQAAESAGSDAVSLINTLTGMSIDVQKRRPKIAAITGGLSGPAVRPIAVRMVWEVYKSIEIPIIGMGGIIDTQSALEFIIAGASAVSIGTANFIDPGVSIEIVEGIKKYMHKNKLRDLRSLIGSLKT